MDDESSRRPLHNRARHKYSHTGCLTCKHRRIKCDEAKPVCRRCRIGGRECRSDGRASDSTVKARYGQERTTDADNAAACLQHFIIHTLPAFRKAEPSLLWTFLERELQSSSSIRNVAVAIGAEHQHSLDTSSQDPAQLTYHLEAVSALRRSITDAQSSTTADGLFTITLSCLLLVILQCFRKSFDDLNVHLQHGLKIAVQAATVCEGETAALLEACLRMLKQYSIAMALFNPLMPQESMADRSLTTTANQALSDPDSLKQLSAPTTDLVTSQLLVNEEQNLLLDLIRTTITRRQPHMAEMEAMDKSSTLSFSNALGSDETLIAIVLGLRTRHTILMQAIMKHKACARSKKQVEFYQVMEARCMLMGVYLRRRWCGYACAMDVEFETFKACIDKIATLLSQNEHNSASSTLSMGFGFVAALFFAAVMCRDTQIRRTAVMLFKKCPQHDGPWNARLVEQICITIIDHEERLAEEDGPGYQLTGHIPEHCRIVHYYYHTTEVQPGFPPKEFVKVFRKHSRLEDYTGEDLQLKNEP